MDSSQPQLLILADAPDALCPLFGVSLLERALRIAQRLGFRQAVIISDSNGVAAQLAVPSWARAQVALSFRRKNADPVTVSEISGSGRSLVVSAGFYYDARLLQALIEQKDTTLLVDSAPPKDCVRLWGNRSDTFGAAMLLDQDWLAR